MGKVENNDVRDYIVNYAISTLESCKLFTDTFGKGYVKKRLDINLDKVYTNEYLKTYMQYLTGQSKNVRDII